MWKNVAGLVALALSGACSSAQEALPQTEIATTVAERTNTLSAEEREAGWELLFDGSTMNGWRGYNRDDLSGGWDAQDGMLTRTGEGGDIITERQFSDFELTVEWRVETSGNSGIFYRVAEGEERIYHSAPEMQVLDDGGHRDGQDPLTSAGANYGLHAAPRGVVNAAGEWNVARIVVEGSHVEHWLNGERMVEYDLGSPEWEELVANSKFGEWPAYGRAERGHIGLQDHGDPVWYRNMKIREIR
jgi:3-keto-disaccharide hydrolase